MKLNATPRSVLSMLFVVVFLIAGGKFSRPTILPTQACLPRIPNLWPLFGKSGDNGAESEQPYDKQAEERSHWTTNDWIVRNKYAFELHNVTTTDGYQLQIQRLPKPGRRPVLLVHGLLTSSLSWVIMGPGKSLAFLLYDKNYDVWLANLRGSPYGRNHTHLKATDVDFWNFSFHEYGVYDLPAIIDHVRNESVYHQVLLIGHSQAFNAFLVTCAVHPIYNERILFMQALAPLTKLKEMVKFSTEDIRMAMKFIKKKRKSQNYQIFPPGELRTKCLRKNSDDRRECLRIYEKFAGSGQHTRSLDPLLFGRLLEGGSIKEITHLQQIWQSDDFATYDYGHIENPRYYNSVSPNKYELQRISVPMVLHYGQSDAFATYTGVRTIYARQMPREVIYGVHCVDARTFNHLDFLLANDVKTLINDKLIRIMEEYFAGTLQYIIE